MVGRRTAGVATVGVLLAGLGAVQLLPEGSSPLAPRSALAGGLVAYDSCAPLLQAYRDELARTATAYGWGANGGIAADAGGSSTGGGPVPVAAAGTRDLALAAAPETDAVGSGPTGTNVQERGVDEPDVVKLAGGHLVTVAGGALRVLSTGDEPVELGRLAFPPDPGTRSYGGSAQELVVVGDRALVVEQGYRVTGTVTPPAPGGQGEQGAVSSSSGGTGADALVAPAPDRPGSYETTVATTVVRLADLSDPAKPRWIESYTVDGGYLSARLVDGTVRLVTRSQPSPVVPAYDQPSGSSQQAYQAWERKRTALNRAAAQKLTLAQVLPQAVRADGAGDTLDRGAAVSCKDVSYAVDSAGGGLLLVTTLHPADGLEPLDSTGVQADGELVYATADRLFVATSRWGTGGAGFARDARAGDEVTTQVHAFDTSRPDALRYAGTGSVKGYVYGRWALSWHEGALRVATTTGEPWAGAARTSSSSVVVLDGALREVGRVDGLGKGEMIKAVRYFGGYATVVTFRQTDPLYVLDLSDPTAPRVTGQLKVPGFSQYLHPIGDHLLLGLGMEADVTTGGTTGMQASVFDLSDPSRPTQVDRLQLGRGYSEALQDSRAFGYDPAQRLAVLPFQDERGGGSGLGIRVAADGRLSLAGTLAVQQGDADVQVCGGGKELVDPAVSCGYGGGPAVRRVVLDGARVHLLTDRSVVTGTSRGFVRTGGVDL